MWAVVFVFPMNAACQVDGGAFAGTGSDVVARYFHAGGRLLHGPVMISGGLNLSIFPPTLISRGDISFYDPVTQTFSAQFDPLDGSGPTFPALTDPRSSHTQTTLHDGRVLIAGGHINAMGTSPGVAFDGVEIFDPWTGTVSVAPSMAAVRAMHTATLLPDGRVVVAGASSWQIFDPADDTWSSNFAMHASRTAHAAVLLTDHDGVAGDDRVLLVGGNGSAPDSMELLDPLLETSTPMTSLLSVGVDDLAAIALADGRVFVVGGQNASTGNTVANTYLFDPVADNIVAGPDVPNRAGGIADHQIVRFADQVAIFGGEQQQGGVDTVLNYAAIFDASTDQWLADGMMINLHDDFVTVPLGACELLIVGGGIPFLGQEIPSANTELFTLSDSGQCTLGDLDNDGDVDADDYDRFAPCLNGPDATSQPAECIHLNAATSDFDMDGDVDLTDFATFAESYGM
ncbi:MAG: hypothetical protein DHS20C16_21720 [Phycisphaerae bacterium]|nr:MAG: hypothetical protein DHS20C16_21720 [Phycisphaerae bacterium]